ncbi:hypothetical protein FIBSPDRAFT_152299 [Athelia psychrophila]|uniref:Uncharacterized protein n=1 Tax=Athelia psychrophila TaxID=1759441 RepID=A0A166BK28_9AGAM|nr:hypothetical protein FIBSPDRAFT_152299 [Fibularhizoctonia sp. CBS 109695]
MPVSASRRPPAGTANGQPLVSSHHLDRIPFFFPLPYAMDTSADLDPNLRCSSAGLAPGAAVSAHPDSCGDPPGLDTSVSHKDHLEQVPSEQSNLIRSCITLSTPKSLHSSVLGSAQSSSSGVRPNTPEIMVDPQFSSLFSPDEPLEDWCARTERLMQLQEEDQHRQVDALPYDPTNDPELTVSIGDPSPEDSDYEHLFSQRPSKRIRITTHRATVACDLCRKSRNKVAPFVLSIDYAVAD